MKRLLTTATIILSLLLLQACAEKIEPEEACHFEQNSQRQRVSWGNSVPVTLHIHANMPVEFHDEVKAAAHEWNKEAGRTLLVISDEIANTSTEFKRDGVSTIYWLDEWDVNTHTEQARTTSYWRGNLIYESDVRLNNRDFSFYSESDANISELTSPVNLRSLLIHEFGHVLGLAHRDGAGSVMSTTLGISEDRSEVPAIDIEALSCEYK